MGIQSNERRGSAMIYTVMVVPVLALLCALSVDWGRVQMVRVELVRACDAAARYAVNGTNDGTALTKANTMASTNLVDGQAPTFAAGDVEVGRWNDGTRTFTAGATPPNAVRVTGRRTVSTVFAGAFGGSAKNVVVQAVAKKNPLGFGLVGIDSLTFGGSATASYSSSGGSGSTAMQGNIASNGTITIGGSSVVNGDAYYGPSGGVTGGSVSGSTIPLGYNLSYPNGDSSPYGPTNNDNASVPTTALNGVNFSLGNNKSVTLPGGHYFFNNFSMNATSSLTFSGPATIYCYGEFDMQGTTSTSGNLPGNLKLVMVPNPDTGAAPRGVNIGSNVSFHASIYAPQSAVVINGNGSIYGSVVGKTVNMTGNGSVYYDMDLDYGNGAISLVK